jgi:hypothetical protein
MTGCIKRDFARKAIIEDAVRPDLNLLRKNAAISTAPRSGQFSGFG